MIRRAARSSLFPYKTVFRPQRRGRGREKSERQPHACSHLEQELGHGARPLSAWCTHPQRRPGRADANGEWLNDTACCEIFTLPLQDGLPTSEKREGAGEK